MHWLFYVRCNGRFATTERAGRQIIGYFALTIEIENAFFGIISKHDGTRKTYSSRRCHKVTVAQLLCALFGRNQPREEYDKRKNENARFAHKMGISFIDADYDPDHWFARVRGLENEPEGGKRCTKCFDLRLERSALYAFENGFPLLTSCFGISRWKDMNQVNACGHRAASRFGDVKYWDYDWRKEGGSLRMIEIAKREEFYRQKYCGCIYSVRNTK